MPEYGFNLIAGAPGAGKTTLAQQLMFALATSERPAIHFTVLGEPPLKLLRYQQQFTFFDAAKLNGSVRLVDLSQQVLQQDLGAVLESILREVEQTNPGIVVVDSFRTVVRAVSDSGEIFIATTSAGSTDVEVLRLGRERGPRGIIRIPGIVADLAIDPKGDRAALVTDQGTYRFSPHATDPGASLQRVGSPVRDVAFGADGIFYQLDKDKVTATGVDGTQKWRAPLTDGRKLVIGARALIWDGPDVVWAIAPDGAIDALGIDGTLQDLVTSADGKRAAVVLGGRRALVFELQ